MVTTARAVVFLCLWLSVCQVRGSHIPSKMNKTIQNLLQHYVSTTSTTTVTGAVILLLAVSVFVALILQIQALCFLFLCLFQSEAVTTKDYCGVFLMFYLQISYHYHRSQVSQLVKCTWYYHMVMQWTAGTLSLVVHSGTSDISVGPHSRHLITFDYCFYYVCFWLPDNRACQQWMSLKLTWTDNKSFCLIIEVNFLYNKKSLFGAIQEMTLKS